MKRGKRVGYGDTKLITRADGCGGMRSANLAIKKAIDAGFIKNVSLIAAGPYIEEAAEMFAGRGDICFGLHTVINSESAHWTPVSDPSRIRSLITEDGYFYKHPICFYEHPPAISEIMLEMQEQLDKLYGLGFHVSFSDYHLAPGLFVPSLEKAVKSWAAKNKLHNLGAYSVLDGFYNVLPLYDEISVIPDAFEVVLRNLPSGQYLYIGYPAVDSEETRFNGMYTAYKRNADAEFTASHETLRLCEKYNVTPVGYRNADPPVVPI